MDVQTRINRGRGAIAASVRAVRDPPADMHFGAKAEWLEGYDAEVARPEIPNLRAMDVAERTRVMREMLAKGDRVLRGVERVNDR